MYRFLAVAEAFVGRHGDCGGGGDIYSGEVIGRTFVGADSIGTGVLHVYSVFIGAAQVFLERYA